MFLGEYSHTIKILAPVVGENGCGHYRVGRG
jgi:hypothetical protein